jgi:hypothetical protein
VQAATDYRINLQPQPYQRESNYLKGKHQQLIESIGIAFWGRRGWPPIAHEKAAGNISSGLTGLKMSWSQKESLRPGILSFPRHTAGFRHGTQCGVTAATQPGGAREHDVRPMQRLG